MAQPQLGAASTSAASAVAEAPPCVSAEEPEAAELQSTLQVVRAADDVAAYWCAAAPGSLSRALDVQYAHTQCPHA